MMKKISELDYSVAYFFPKLYHHKVLNSVMKFITKVGDLGLVWLTAILILSTTAKTRVLSQQMLFALILATIIGQFLIKLVIKRERPCQVYQDIKMLVPIPTDSSFPSGHTTSSFACATVICFSYPEIGIACLLFAILMGLSRLYLFVHYLSDILFGTILGILIGLFVIII